MPVLAPDTSRDTSSLSSKMWIPLSVMSSIVLVSCAVHLVRRHLTSNSKQSPRISTGGEKGEKEALLQRDGEEGSYSGEENENERKSEAEMKHPRIPRPPQPPPFTPPLQSGAFAPFAPGPPSTAPTTRPQTLLTDFSDFRREDLENEDRRERGGFADEFYSSPVEGEAGEFYASPTNFEPVAMSAAQIVDFPASSASIDSFSSEGMPRRRSYTKSVSREGSGSGDVEVTGEIVMGEGWRRHTRVFGGGVCRACEESKRVLGERGMAGVGGMVLVGGQ